jgi:chromosome segregation ATPase
LVADLNEENAEEIKHKEFCVDEFNKNTLDTERADREKEDLVAKIEDLDMTIKMLTDTITMLESDIFDMNKQLKKAGEERAKQNKEFQQTVADQRATQQLLSKALTVLEGFYGKKAAALVQRG